MPQDLEQLRHVRWARAPAQLVRHTVLVIPSVNLVILSSSEQSLHFGRIQYTSFSTDASRFCISKDRSMYGTPVDLGPVCPFMLCTAMSGAEMLRPKTTKLRRICLSCMMRRHRELSKVLARCIERRGVVHLPGGQRSTQVWHVPAGHCGEGTD